MKRHKKALLFLTLFLAIVGLGFVFFQTGKTESGTYIWSEDAQTLTIGNKTYQYDSELDAMELALGKKVGMIQGEDSSLGVYAIEGKEKEEYVVIYGEMFPSMAYRLAD